MIGRKKSYNSSCLVKFVVRGLLLLTPDDLYTLVGHTEIQKDLDVKTLVLDLIRERIPQDEIISIFWRHLEGLDEEFVKGYFYRRF